MKDPIFKTGDRVYHPYWGWGKIVKYEDGQYCIDHGGQTHFNGQDYTEKMYSFTEYDPVKAGLSHKRERFKQGDFVVSSSNEIIIVTAGIEEAKTGYPCFSGVMIVTSLSSAWPVGHYSKTWNQNAFTLIQDLWKS